MSISRYINTEELNIRNPLFYANSDITIAGTDIHDIGLLGKYTNGLVIKYTGLFRDASDATYKLFDNLTVSPNIYTGYVNTADASFQYASLKLKNISTTGDVIIDGDLTVYGSTVINVSSLSVESNLIIANSGPANIKPDAGFVINRAAIEMVTDDPKITGTASASGTTTTITLAAGPSQALDYYANWAIYLTGDVSTIGLVTASTTGSPPVLTFDVPASGPTSTSTTYALFNKHYIGNIWNESNKQLSAFGFPRQDSTGIISTDGYLNNGNLADYVDVKANNINANGDLTVNGKINANVQFSDNIIAINTGPNMSADGGYVVERIPSSVTTNDSAKHASVVINTNYTSGSYTIEIINTASGVGYFIGWIIRYNTNTSESTVITASTNVGNVHTLTLRDSFPVNLTAGSDTVSLYNKRYTGLIWQETMGYHVLVGFPREIGETVIDTTNPVNGNFTNYMNLVANNVTIKGRVTLQNGILYTCITFITPITFTTAQIFQNDYVYFNPTGPATFTLPSVSSLISVMPSSKTKLMIFANISIHPVTIQANVADTIEGRSQIILRSLYAKTTLSTSTNTPNSWEVKG